MSPEAPPNLTQFLQCCSHQPIVLPLPEEEFTAGQAQGRLLPSCHRPPGRRAVLEPRLGVLHSRRGQQANVHPQQLGQEPQEHLLREHALLGSMGGSFGAWSQHTRGSDPALCRLAVLSWAQSLGLYLLCTSGSPGPLYATCAAVLA